jgi:hypothetical protein
MSPFKIVLVWLSCFPFLGMSQVDHEAWLSGGAKYSVNKKFDLSGELNLRMEPIVVNTFFTELTAKFEVKKWFKPSVDYRFVLDRNKFGNYKLSHRVNFNANVGTTWNRFDFGLRVRYQTTLSRVRTPESSFSDLAPGFRIKPSILYDINNSIISPEISTEFFFDRDAIDGVFLNKLRFSAGAEFETLGPYNVSLKYMYGMALHGEKYEHLVSFSFTRKYKSAKAKKKKDKKKN